MTRKAILTLLIILFFSEVSSFGQIDSLKSFITALVKIKLIENNNNAEYLFKGDLNYLFVSGDSIKVSPVKYNFTVSIDDLKSITLKSGNRFNSGLIAGSVTGFILGFLGSFIVFDRNNIFGSIAGGLLLSLPFAGFGAMLGNNSEADKDFDLGSYPLTDKKALLIKILRDNRYKK